MNYNHNYFMWICIIQCLNKIKQYSCVLLFFCSRVAATDRHGSVSEADSDEENEEGDYTVYECPGLAPVRVNFTC